MHSTCCHRDKGAPVDVADLQVGERYRVCLSGESFSVRVQSKSEDGKVVVIVRPDGLEQTIRHDHQALFHQQELATATPN